MSSYSKRERVDAALRGEIPDRVPVSAWRHFIPDEQKPETLARASLNHFTTFDWDWLKLNARATYYEEAWGSRFDYGGNGAGPDRPGLKLSTDEPSSVPFSYSSCPPSEEP